MRIGSYLVLTLAALFSLFCLALIFVGSFTTAVIFPGDHDGSKASGFFLFALFFAPGLWFAGGLMLTTSEPLRQSKAKP